MNALVNESVLLQLQTDACVPSLEKLRAQRGNEPPSPRAVEQPGAGLQTLEKVARPARPGEGREGFLEEETSAAAGRVRGRLPNILILRAG